MKIMCGIDVALSGLNEPADVNHWASPNANDRALSGLNGIKKY
ncbi:hypothetical protein OF897_14545 [Chryseobacterium formosus]|uniref:Transposase n=1 Tax=Chryseobacterium formosus TaxID=1537363 RepID=A0ABT3XTF4_9FLAO|nr:hypothetical protein [Chryseobacterium formosus]MCX8525136.1 hypothetical protein [Chryseobacterium formosus]